MPPDDRHFIDHRLSILLDLMRAAAALMVLVGHAASFGFFQTRLVPRRYTGLSFTLYLTTGQCWSLP